MEWTAQEDAAPLRRRSMARSYLDSLTENAWLVPVLLLPSPPFFSFGSVSEIDRETLDVFYSEMKAGKTRSIMEIDQYEVGRTERAYGQCLLPLQR